MNKASKVSKCNNANSIKSFINSCQNSKTFNYYLYFMVLILALLLKIDNIYVDIATIAIILFSSAILKIDKLMVVYVFLCFFDSVMKIDLIGGSITRIVTCIGLLRLIILYFKDRINMRNVYLYILIFLSIYFVYSILIGQEMIKTSFLYINFVFSVLLINYLSYKKKSERNQIYRDAIESVLYGVSFSIIYGLIVGNYMIEQRNGFITKRFNGTIDPNFTAFYINVALVINMFRDRDKRESKCNIIVNYVIYGILIIGLLLTKSITGITINIVSMIVFSLIKYKKNIKRIIFNRKRFLLLISIFLVIITVFGYFVIYKNYNNVHYDPYGNVVANNRIADIIQSVKKMDINSLTSHKADDWHIYLNDIINSSFDKIMFGHGMYPELLYSDYFSKNVESHNTYIDFLRCYGFVGAIIIIIFIFKKTKRNLFLCNPLQNRTLKYARIIILIYAIELSIYTGRFFWFMFFI